MEANRIRNNWRNMVNWMNRNEWNFCKSQKCVALCATEKSIGNALFDFNSTENENLFSAITFTPTFSMLSSIFELQKKIYYFSFHIFFVSNSFPKNEINRFLIERYKWPMKDEKRFDMKWCNWFHKLNMVLAHSNPFRFFFCVVFCFAIECRHRRNNCAFINCPGASSLFDNSFPWTRDNTFAIFNDVYLSAAFIVKCNLKNNFGNHLKCLSLTMFTDVLLSLHNKSENW